MTTQREEIQQRVINVVKDVLNIDEELTAETDLITDLHADSVDIVSLLMDLEDEFEAKISEEEAQKLTSIGKIVDYIEQKAMENS
jgi:acyl carrier protein